MSRLGILAGAVALGLAGGAGGYFYGVQQGRQLEAGAHNGKLVQDLTGVLSNHEKLVQAAQSASKDMRRATAARQQADEQTTREFQDALSSTASSRVGCVFDAGVMRQLGAARERAAEAAASGLRATVPGTGAGAGER